MIEFLTAADFESLPERRICALAAQRRFVFEIKEVRPLPGHGARKEPFAILLRDPGAKTSIAQGIFRYAHPVKGELDLFTVPLGPDDSGMCYEIIFN